MPIKKEQFESGEEPVGLHKPKKPKEKKKALPSYALRPPREREVKKEMNCFQDYCNNTTVVKCLYCGRFLCEEHIHTKKHDCPCYKVGRRR